jgi:hypothetical protein
MMQFAAMSSDAHVEPLGRLGPRQLNEPATERAAIFLVNEIADFGRARIERPRIHAEDPQCLIREHDIVAWPVPLPASDAGDPLRARQLLRQAAVRRILILGDSVRGLEPLLAARDATMHVVEPAL